MAAMRSFALTKWYLDCVAESGGSAIGYWAALRWGRVTAVWQAIAFDDPAGPPAHRREVSLAPSAVKSSLTAEPAWANGSLRWDSPALGCRLSFLPSLRPFGARLLDSDGGTVDWHPEAAAAAVSVDCDGRQPFHGTGYAERLVLTVPPWRLPLDELRWGRWVSLDASRSIVWIDWRGTPPRTFMFVDGVRVSADRISDDRVAWGSEALALSGRQELHRRPLGDLIGPLRRVASRLPAGWLALEDRKWRSRGTLIGGGSGSSIGWAIHEEVKWP